MRAMIGFVSAAALSVIATAQSPPDPLETCAQKSDAAARLACFDQEMQRRHATNMPREAPVGATSAPVRAPRAPTAGQPGGAAPGTAASHAEENAGLQGPQLRKKLREQGVTEPPKPNPIVAQVTRAVWRPDHRYTLVLDNGQIWEQVEEQQGVYVDAHETVTISPGVLGAFFVETSNRKSFRVRRLQ